MKLKSSEKIVAGARLIGAAMFGRKIPLSVGWAITKRCNARCVYCGKWKDPNDDTPHEEAVSLCDQFITAGVRLISLTGGEPLLREDISELMIRLKAGRIHLSLSSNGILLPRRLDAVRLADRVNVSIDGPREVHDRFRGSGQFDLAVEGIRAVKNIGVPVSMTTVLHSANFSCVDDILRLAGEFGCSVNFQPVVPAFDSSSRQDDVMPDKEKMRFALTRLLEIKRTSAGRMIENSIPTLRHFMGWPKGIPIPCESRLVSCRVETDGHVHNCGRQKNNLDQTDYRVHGFLAAFQSLPKLSCANCWCSNRYEINALMSLRPNLMLDIFKRF